MKKFIPVILGVIFLSCLSTITAQTKKDTTVYFSNKKIMLNDSVGQLQVKVYEKGDTIPFTKVYEGIFTDEKSVENYSVVGQTSFDFPFNRHKDHSHINGHFVSFGMGSLYITDDLSNFNDINGLQLSFSNEISWNAFGYTLPVYKNFVGLTTGIGMNWRNYHLADNTHLVVNDGITTVQPAPSGINYTSSRLRTFEFTVPLYLDLQPLGNDKLFLTAGVLFGVNTFTSYKVKYKNSDGDKVKKVEGRDYKVNPFSLSYVLQVGYNDLGIYAKYTPTSVFKKDKGPEVQSASIGVTLGL